MVSLEDDITDIDEEWLKIAESYVQGYKQAYCDMLFVRERLLKLRKKYIEEHEDLIQHMSSLEDKMSKSRWKKSDKFGLIGTGGILYPVIKKMHKNEIHDDSVYRNEMCQRIMKLEKNIFPRINKMIKTINNRTK